MCSRVLCAGGRASSSSFSKKLGWAVDGPRAEFLARWQADKSKTEHKLLDELAGDDGQPEGAPILRRFDVETERLREQLVAQLGISIAQRVSQEIRLFKYELPNGGWYQVDAAGPRIRDAVNAGPGC